MFWHRFVYFLLLIVIYTFYLFYRMWFAWYCLVMVILIPILSGIFCWVLFSQVEINPETTRVVLKDENAFFTLAPVQHGIVGILTVTAKGKLMDYMAGKEENIKTKSRLASECHYVLDTKHCGVYDIKITRVNVYDFFGIFRFPKRVNYSSRVIVKPVPVTPERMPDLTGFKAKYLRKSNRLDSEIYDIKEYTEGDSIKAIHWKLSAKKGKAYVKEPQEEYNAHARVYLELENDRDEVDKRLGELVFTSRYFLSQDVEHRIRVLPPHNKEICFDIGSNYDVDKMLLQVMMMDLSKVMLEKDNKPKSLGSSEEVNWNE